MDFSKPVKVSELLENLELVHDIPQNYIILQDGSMMGVFSKMIDAINELDELGWETVSISNSDGSTMYALVRRMMKPKHKE